MRVTLLALTLLLFFSPAAAKEVPADRLRELLIVAGAASPRMAMIASKQLDKVVDARKVAPLIRLVRSDIEKLRLYSARELGRIADPKAISVLLDRITDDGSRRVREAAANAAVGIDRKTTLHWLVARFEAHGGGLTRNHVYVGSQLAFVQDFDVEVA